MWARQWNGVMNSTNNSWHPKCVSLPFDEMRMGDKRQNLFEGFFSNQKRFTRVNHTRSLHQKQSQSTLRSSYLSPYENLIGTGWDGRTCSPQHRTSFTNLQENVMYTNSRISKPKFAWITTYIKIIWFFILPITVYERDGSVCLKTAARIDQCGVAKKTFGPTRRSPIMPVYTYMWNYCLNLICVHSCICSKDYMKFLRQLVKPAIISYK